MCLIVASQQPRKLNIFLCSLRFVCNYLFQLWNWILSERVGRKFRSLWNTHPCIQWSFQSHDWCCWHPIHCHTTEWVHHFSSFLLTVSSLPDLEHDVNNLLHELQRLLEHFLPLRRQHCFDLPQSWLIFFYKKTHLVKRTRGDFLRSRPNKKNDGKSKYHSNKSCDLWL